MPPQGPQTVTVPNVQLVKVGTWPASTGMTRVTPEDLESMVAAEADPAVLPAVVKLGHLDPRFDGEPAYGWVRNLRIVGEVLVGDLADVPAGLAEILPKAFRQRSVEIAWGVRTAGGTRHKAALAGLALLGSTPPAVAGLADIEALYRTAASATAVDSVTPLAVGADGAPVVHQGTAQPNAGPLAQGWEALASLAAALVRAESPPVVQTVSDQHQRPPEGNVNDQRIRELLGVAERQGAEAVVAALRADVAASSTPPQGGAAPTPPAGTPAPDNTPAAPGGGLATAAGTASAPGGHAPGAPLPEQGAGAQSPAGPASGAPAPAGAAPAAGAGTATPPATGSAAAPAATTPPAGVPGLPPGMTVISAEVLEQLQANAAAGAQAAATLSERELEQELVGTFAGRWLPSERPSLLTWLRTDPVNARANLSARPQLLPTTEIGHGDAPSAEADDAAWEAFEVQVGLREPTPPQSTTAGGAQ